MNFIVDELVEAVAGSVGANGVPEAKECRAVNF